MENLKIDRRIRTTKKNLRNALMELLRNQELHQITVKELCIKAEINRGTFYSHYQDIDDLFHQVEQELYTEIRVALENNLSQFFVREDATVFVEVFRCLTAYADMCMILLTRGTDFAFVTQVVNYGKEVCLAEWTSHYPWADRYQMEQLYAFFAAGSLSLLSHWSENGRREPPEDLARLAERIVLSGLEVLKQPTPLHPGKR